jgi:hypothetical protein
VVDQGFDDRFWKLAAALDLLGRRFQFRAQLSRAIDVLGCGRYRHQAI